jgi:diadenosine tetraphosphatase ApaH/serine/threonine PP2A family protein phosphatase
VELVGLRNRDPCEVGEIEAKSSIDSMIEELPCDRFLLKSMAEWDSLHVVELQRQFSETIAVSESAALSLLQRFISIVAPEPNILQLTSPITVCGDIHGQLFDLFNLFEASGFSETKKYVFMGDYVDRGHQSILTFLYLAFLKVKFPNNIFLLRGNHESRSVNSQYGLYFETENIYGHYGMWALLNEVFDYLPCCAIVDNEIFCVHGGLSPQAISKDKIWLIPRPCDLDTNALFVDLTWSDPDGGSEWIPSQRGQGYLFGEQHVQKFLQVNRLKRIARSHQVQTMGYRWYFDKQLILVWSAPNYQYKSRNKATVMEVSRDTEPTFVPVPANERSPVARDDGLVVLDYFA